MTQASGVRSGREGHDVERERRPGRVFADLDGGINDARARMAYGDDQLAAIQPDNDTVIDRFGSLELDDAGGTSSSAPVGVARSDTSGLESVVAVQDGGTYP